MTDRSKRPYRQALAFVLVATAAGFAAIYGMHAGSGNLGAAECGDALKAGERIRPLLSGDMAAFQLRAEPFQAGNLSFRNGKGAQTSLAAWAGKTVLLNLWATWCVPCRTEMPALETLQKEMGGDSFEVLPVSVDLGDPDKPKRFYAEAGIAALSFNHDGTMEIFNQLKKAGLAFGMPASLLIDAKGCVIGSLNGPAEWAGADARALIAAAIAP